MDDDVFRALADPTRRELLDRLAERNGQSLKDLGHGLEMARQSVSKHLQVLVAAHLVTTMRSGRESLHFLNAEPINAIADRWMDKYDHGRARALAGLKQALEEKPMSRASSEFVYTTYIRSTPEQVWRGLTEPEFTRQYWGVELRSDWAEGSPIVWSENGATISDPEQKVLRARPYEELSYTWHTPTPEWAAGSGVTEEVRAALAADPRSSVTFTITPEGPEVVRLTLVHAGAPGSRVLDLVRHGWPSLMAGLKTLLETGAPLVSAAASSPGSSR